MRTTSIKLPSRLVRMADISSFRNMSRNTLHVMSLRLVAVDSSCLSSLDVGGRPRNSESPRLVLLFLFYPFTHIPHTVRVNTYFNTLNTFCPQKRNTALCSSLVKIKIVAAMFPATPQLTHCAQGHVRQCIDKSSGGYISIFRTIRRHERR
jgi:hypothetical protein